MTKKIFDFQHMKILLVNKYWYIRGGAERVVFDTKKVLEDTGHEVEIFGMRHEKNIIENDYFIDEIDYKDANVFKKIIYGCKSIYNKDAKNKFEKCVQDFKPDVVHFHNIYHQLSFSLLDIVKKYKIPSVMTLHDYKMVSPNYNLYHHGHIDENSCGKNYYKCIFDNCMGYVGQSIFATIEMYVRTWKKYESYIHTYISPSEFLRQKFVDVGFKKNIEVIPNPLDVAVYKCTVTAGDGVVYFGRLSDEKGVCIISEIARKIPNIHYTMIGDGPLRVMLKEKNIANVDIIGYKTGDELSTLVSGARLIIMPSQWYENYPMTILEAKAMGKPVIASDIGGIGEMLPHDMLAQYDDVASFVEKVQVWYGMSDKKLISIGKKLQTEVKNINSFDIYKRKLVALYERVTK